MVYKYVPIITPALIVCLSNSSKESPLVGLISENSSYTFSAYSAFCEHRPQITLSIIIGPVATQWLDAAGPFASLFYPTRRRWGLWAIIHSHSLIMVTTNIDLVLVNVLDTHPELYITWKCGIILPFACWRMCRVCWIVMVLKVTERDNGGIVGE